MNVEQTGFDARPHEIKEHSTDDSGKVDNLIEYFLRNKDVAPWFRGTSIFHLQGSDELFNAIRDDTEQRTTHRVMNCLNLIGLDPMITSKEIAFLMRLSRGNDLAFLWFLLELHYQSPQAGNVGVNEQLICTAICHLDMISTLRELDKILPSGHPSQRNDRQQAPHPSKDATQLSMKEGRRQARGPKYVLPYFEKLRRPTTYGLPLTIEIPNFEVDFSLYAPYKDPNYKVPNESNRWFADYDFNPGRRVAYDIIRNAISEIFDNFEAAKLKANTIKVLCRYHKALKRREDNFKHELRVKIRDKCLKRIFGNDLEKKKERLCRVKESLHMAIEQQLGEFRRQTTRDRKEFTLKTLTSDCDIVDVVVGREYDECCRISGKNTEEIKTAAPNAVIQGSGDNVAATVQSTTTSGPKGNKGRGDFVNIPLPKAAVENLKQAKLNSSNVDNLTKGQSPSQMSVFAANYMKNYEYGRVGDTPNPSQTFFHANTEHRPYQFDYRKIFLRKGENNDNDTKARMKAAFLEALDKDIATLTELEVAQTNLNLAANECANNTWSSELRQYKAQHQRDTTIMLSAKAHYDPEDKNLMDKMLSDAFEELRKNPKFVLAQLPEAHKLPMLREWISRRYGKVYSPKQRFLSYQYSLKIFHALDRMSFDLPTPTATQLGKNQFVKYNCRDYLVKKIKHIKDNFYRRLDDEIMNQSGNYWFAMRGYLCSNGPPRQTFFAYMPSRFRDIQHFRLWKSSEHRPDKMVWDKRQQANKRL